ncbi:MAG: DAK2 domain-containing protein [Malacoplasma sp.]
MLKTIDVKTLVKMFKSGSDLIAKNYEYMNELNVFPVPDGDTGTNLKITTKNSIELTIQKIKEDTTLFEFGSIFSRQLLMNARGNSGVIFSQIIKGFFEPIKEDTTCIDPKLFIECIKTAKEKSYKSVINPIEGTILTIVRICSEKLENKEFTSINLLLKELIKISLNALKQTPDMLPSLKEANVVDSGGYGLCKFFEGLYIAIIEKGNPELEDSIVEEADVAMTHNKLNFIKTKERSEISEEGFGYCCEFIISLNFITVNNQKNKIPFNRDEFQKKVLKFSDSLVLVEDEDIIKIHLHSVDPYKFLQLGQKYGEFLKIKIENMTLQYLEMHPDLDGETLFKTDKLTSESKIIITAPSQEIGEYFIEKYNVSAFINTEKSGNPSTSEIISTIKSVNSENIILIVDDTNIILSAEQAIELIGKDYKVSLIKGKNIIEALFSCKSFSDKIDVNSNYKIMSKIIKKGSSASISTSIKSAKFKNVVVNKDDYIGIMNKEIIASDKELSSLTLKVIDKLFASFKLKKTSEFYLIYGKDVLMKTIRNIEKYVNEKYGVNCNIINGKQLIYNFFMGIK